MLTTLGELTQTSHVVSQLTGVGGLQNVVQEQLEEASKKGEKARDDYLPWIIGGAAAYFILPKLLQTYVRK